MAESNKEIFHVADGYESFLIETGRILIHPVTMICGTLYLLIGGIAVFTFDVLWGIILLAIFVIIHFLIDRLIVWFNPEWCKKYWWQLGDDEIEIHQGVLSSNVAHIPYSRVQNVVIKQSFFERKMGGFFQIVIETAGSAGPRPEGLLQGIKNIEEVQKLVQDHVKQYRKGAGLGDNIVSLTSAAKSLDIGNQPELLKKLDQILNKLEEITTILKTK